MLESKVRRDPPNCPPVSLRVNEETLGLDWWFGDVNPLL